ncbi:MAG: DNA polymerase III subunit epsilon [Betaproteobacteria bacterium]|nr:DNA polymerase III subunit epsilon [Betaproteobacteria bacterium]
MKPNHKAVFALLGFLVLFLGVTAAAGWTFYYDLEPESKRRLVEIAAPRAQLVIGLAVLASGVLAAVFIVAYKSYVRGALEMAEAMHIMLEANPARRIDVEGPAELRLIAQSANALAEHSQALARDLETKVQQAKSSVEEEKHRLAALMSELSQGVLVCNIDGRILLYNESARQALGAGGPASSSLIGLGRSIFTVVDRSLLAHALETVESRLERREPYLNAQFVTTTRAGQLIRVQMAPVLATSGAARDAEPGASAQAHREQTTITGFVMMLENITRSVERDTKRDLLLQAFTEASRASLASIRAAVETLTEYPDCAPHERDRFIRVIREEVGHLGGKLEQTTADYASALKTRWPLEEILGTDVIDALRRQIENRLGIATKVENLDDALWIKADSYTLMQALTYLAGRLKEEFKIRELRFNLSAHAGFAELDLMWSGPTISQQTVYEWEMDAMHAGGEYSPLTLRDVTERHDAETVFILDKVKQQAVFRLLLPLAKPVQPTPGLPRRYDESRPVFFDFDLFHQGSQSPELDSVPLTMLSYTVIDTETTGLDPSGGDEIVALGAVRIVNGRLLRHETYEQLVDPKRLVGMTAETIHGISQEMLRGQPPIEEVLPQLHQFCVDTVLVGHNMAFDMRFLQMKEAASGVRFTQPVLDTLLLSEVLHPNQPSHALEAIAERLGVTIVARHTALGDALVTGEVFLRMIPILEARGIRTLGAAREASQNTLRARVEY